MIVGNLLMRKSFLLLLLAGAAVPAFAAEENDDPAAPREAPRAERSDARGERNAVRSQPSVRSERSFVARGIEPGEGDGPVMRRANGERMLERRSPRVVEAEPVRPTLEHSGDAVQPRVRERRGPRIVEFDSPRPALEQREGTDSVREWRRAERDSARRPALVEQRTDTGWEPLRRQRDQTVDAVRDRIAPMISRVPREGTQPPLRAVADGSGTAAHRWRGDWRSDRRYDWRRHRDRHRSLFRFGFYYDPFGWSYRPYSVGWRLWPSYYRSSYWLHDAWTYRLPYAPPGYRWIRYYDDVLLVDTWDGRVVDVIRNFFW